MPTGRIWKYYKNRYIKYNTLQKKNPMKFFITTRNRAKNIINCLKTLDYALSKGFANGIFVCYVIDDSTDYYNYFIFTSFIKNSKFRHLRILHLTKKHFLILFDILKKKLKYDHYFVLSNYCKPLGKGEWNHAKVRNLAFLIANSTIDFQESAIFLDDDILFSDTNYLEFNYFISGHKAIQGLITSLIHNQKSVTGLRITGVSDQSITENFLSSLSEIIQKINDNDLKQNDINNICKLLCYPHSIKPNIIISNPNKNKIKQSYVEFGPGEISGAAFATNLLSISSLGFMNSYNEDWIWLNLLGKNQEIIKITDGILLHAPPRMLETSLEFIKYQEYGEIIHQTITRVLENCPEDAEPNEYCILNLSIECHKEIINECCQKYLTCMNYVNVLEYWILNYRKNKNQIFIRKSEMIERIIDIKKNICEVFAFLNKIESNEILSEIRDYLISIPKWRKSLRIYRELIRNSLSALGRI